MRTCSSTMRHTLVAMVALLGTGGCGEDEIPAEVIQATTPEEPPPREPEPPVLSPTEARFEAIPTPAGAKHQTERDGRFRYMVQATPGAVIGYMKDHVIAGTVELDGAATKLRNAVAKQSDAKRPVEVSIKPATPGWTLVEITTGPGLAPEHAGSEADVLKAAETNLQQAN